MALPIMRRVTDLASLYPGVEVLNVREHETACYIDMSIVSLTCLARLVVCACNANVFCRMHSYLNFPGEDYSDPKLIVFRFISYNDPYPVNDFSAMESFAIMMARDMRRYGMLESEIADEIIQDIKLGKEIRDHAK